MHLKSTFSIMFAVLMVYLGAQTIFFSKQIRDLREKIDIIEQDSEILSRHILEKLDQVLEKN